MYNELLEGLFDYRKMVHTIAVIFFFSSIEMAVETKRKKTKIKEIKDSKLF